MQEARAELARKAANADAAARIALQAERDALEQEVRRLRAADAERRAEERARLREAEEERLEHEAEVRRQKLELEKHAAEELRAKKEAENAHRLAQEEIKRQNASEQASYIIKESTLLCPLRLP